MIKELYLIYLLLFHCSGLVNLISDMWQWIHTRIHFISYLNSIHFILDKVFGANVHLFILLTKNPPALHFFHVYCTFCIKAVGGLFIAKKLIIFIIIVWIFCVFVCMPIFMKNAITDKIYISLFIYSFHRRYFIVVPHLLIMELWWIWQFITFVAIYVKIQKVNVNTAVRIKSIIKWSIIK